MLTEQEFNYIINLSSYRDNNIFINEDQFPDSLHHYINSFDNVSNAFVETRYFDNVNTVEMVGDDQYYHFQFLNPFWKIQWSGCLLKLNSFDSMLSLSFRRTLHITDIDCYFPRQNISEVYKQKTFLYQTSPSIDSPMPIMKLHLYGKK